MGQDRELFISSLDMDEDKVCEATKEGMKERRAIRDKERDDIDAKAEAFIRYFRNKLRRQMQARGGA